MWNLVSRMSREKPFVQECLSLGVVGGLCGAAKGAADLLLALEEVSVGGLAPVPTCASRKVDEIVSLLLRVPCIK